MSEALTALIMQAQGGDRGAADQLFAIVYNELRAVAGRQLQRVGGSEMGVTSLVHESYLRLIRGMSLGTEGRAHFFATAARAMRHIAIDQHSAQIAAKRGGRLGPVSLEAVQEPSFDIPLEAVDLIALDRALQLLDSFDSRLLSLVELRFFAGMSLEEVGEALGLSSRTLKRDWRKARAFLQTQLNGRAD